MKSIVPFNQGTLFILFKIFLNFLLTNILKCGKMSLTQKEN